MEIIIVALLSMFVGGGVVLTAKHDSEKDKKQLEAPVSTFSAARKAVVDHNESQHISKKSVERAMVYVNKGLPVDYVHVIRQRLDDPQFNKDSVFDYMCSIVEDFTALSATEQKELTTLRMESWVSNIKSRVESVVANEDILTEVAGAHERDSPRQLEAAHPSSSWEEQFAELDSSSEGAENRTEMKES